jgi:predicted Zn-dependent peptidase
VLVIEVDRSKLPGPGPEPAFRFPVVERQVLRSGLKVWTVEHREVPVLAVLLLLSRGAAEDPADRPGLASLTADMLDEGAGPRSALELEDAFSRLGTELDTEIGPDATVLSLLALSRFRDQVLELLSDVVQRPSFAAGDFDRVRALRLNRLLQLGDVPSVVADRALTRLLYPGHPYGHLPIGTAEGLRAADLEEARLFHGQAWRPEQVTLILVGDGRHAELVQAAERAFGDWQSSTGTPDGADVSPPPPRTEPTVALVHRPGAAQSEVRVGQVSEPRLTPDYHALVLLNAILGGQFVSRLNMNLREDKGYTYGVRSGFDFRKGRGPFLVQAAVQTDSTAHAVEEVLREIRELGTTRPPTRDELDLARSSVTRGYPRNFETAGQIARGLAQLALYGLPDDTFERYVPSFEAVAVEHVTSAAQRLDPRRMVVTVVGDGERVAPSLSSIGLGKVVELEGRD